MFNQYIIKHAIQETLSDRLAETETTNDLEKWIREKTFDFQERTGISGYVYNSVESLWRYYMNPSVNTHKRAFTKRKYEQYVKEGELPIFAIGMAKATPIKIENKFLQYALSVSYGVIAGRSLSKGHFKKISVESGISENILMASTLLVEYFMNKVTRYQVYGQLYVLTKGVKAIVKDMTEYDMPNITPSLNTITDALTIWTAASALLFFIGKKYIRAYQSSTSLPTGIPVFWGSTTQEVITYSTKKFKEWKNPHKSYKHEEHADHT
ncbi:TPA: hypothetical protein HA235_04790 [Candidatus Woesearchaeota archaeon]|nr:hypothetical protein [Candidatus Woesearchaeota archaeon]